MRNKPATDTFEGEYTKRKVYGEDISFVRIYEMIKMRMPISLGQREYFENEKQYYDL